MVEEFHLKELLLIFQDSCDPRKKDQSVFLERGVKEFGKDIDELIFSVKENV